MDNSSEEQAKKLKRLKKDIEYKERHTTATKQELKAVQALRAANEKLLEEQRRTLRQITAAVTSLKRKLREEDKTPEDEPDVNENLLCIICTQMFMEPVSLPCGHVFCKQCITESWNTGRLCPYCRKVPGIRETESLPRVLVVDRLVQDQVRRMSLESRIQRLEVMEDRMAKRPRLN